MYYNYLLREWKREENERNEKATIEYNNKIKQTAQSMVSQPAAPQPQVQVQPIPQVQPQAQSPFSGRYNGFYVHNGERYSMTVTFNFNNGNITGNGGDTVGYFTYNGTYNTFDNYVVMIKSYKHTGHTVQYTGYYSPQDAKISGDWNFPDYPYNKSPFEFVLQR